MIKRSYFSQYFTVGCLLALLLAPSQLLAKQVENLNDYLSKNNLQEVGKARFSVLFWDIYDSKLFTSSGSYLTNFPANQTILFEIQYLRDINRDDLIDKTIDQWQYIGIKEKEYTSYIPLLQKIWPNIKANDKLALLIENESSQFFYNNQFIGRINQKQFHQNFINIWLSPETSQPKLRKALLGL